MMAVVFGLATECDTVLLDRKMVNIFCPCMHSHGACHREDCNQTVKLSAFYDVAKLWLVEREYC